MIGKWFTAYIYAVVMRISVGTVRKKEDAGGLAKKEERQVKMKEWMSNALMGLTWASGLPADSG